MLKEILAISGKPGLYKLVSQAKNGIVVESLIDKKRMAASATSRISALEDIAIFTEDGDVHLSKVFKNIHEKEEGKNTISHKASNKEIKDLFDEILPEYDKDRVYVSDMKKVINWYNILNENNLLDFSKLEEESEEEKAEE